MATRTWVARNRRRIEIRNMSYDHLVNAIWYLRKQGFVTPKEALMEAREVLKGKPCERLRVSSKLAELEKQRNKLQTIH